MSQFKQAWLIGLAVIACILCLTWPGMATDKTPPNTAKVPVVLDGRELFEIGSLASFTASERAGFATGVMYDQMRRLPSTVPIRVTQLQRGDLITLRLSGRNLLTITAQDLMGGITAEEQADLWANQLQSALEQARLERTRQYRRQTLVNSMLVAVE